jgi:hypothetical protein
MLESKHHHKMAYISHPVIRETGKKDALFSTHKKSHINIPIGLTPKIQRSWIPRTARVTSSDGTSRSPHHIDAAFLHFDVIVSAE